MKNIHKIIFPIILGLFISGICLESCRTNWDIEDIFYETENINDSVTVSGSIAFPLMNSYFSLADLIPEGDSSIWVEIDSTGLLHLMMYSKFQEITSSQIWPVSIPAPGLSVEEGVYEVQTDTFKMKVYQKMLSGRLYFKDPRIYLKFENWIPLVSKFSFDTLTFHREDGSFITKTNNTEYTINAPQQPNTKALTNITIDSNAISGLGMLFSPIPKYISYYFKLRHEEQVMPFGLTGSEPINISATIDLPMDARLLNLQLVDTVKLDFTDDTYNQVKNILLKIEMDNGFPVDGFCQLLFVDSLYNRIDSVFTFGMPDVENLGWHMLSALTDNSGKVLQSKKSRIHVSLNWTRVNNLRNKQAKHMLVRSTLNSYNSYIENPTQYIRIYSNYKLGFKIGFKIDYIVSSTDTLINQ